ncbi:DNA-binding protein snt1, partial [Spiromyces aspiralis]
MEKEERERPRSAGGSKGRARRTPDNSYDPTMEAELEAISLHSRRAGQPLSAGLGDLYTSDAVRSEAELIEVIQRLQYDELRNPDIRSRRTTASIPNMVLDHQERVALQFNNENHK